MHPNEFTPEPSLVVRLIKEQMPKWAGLKIKQVASFGTDHTLYRLGEEMVIRLPRINWAAPHIDKEFLWLKKIAPYLPFSIPTPLAKGKPSFGYPFPWSVYKWIEGQNPKKGPLTDSFIQECASFIQAMHAIDLKNGPPSERGKESLKQRELFFQLLETDDLTQKRARAWALSIALIQLPYYQKSNLYLANQARYVLEQMLEN